MSDDDNVEEIDDVSSSPEGADTRGGRGAVDHEEDEELGGRAEERLQVPHPDLHPGFTIHPLLTMLLDRWLDYRMQRVKTKAADSKDIREGIELFEEKASC